MHERTRRMCILMVACASTGCLPQGTDASRLTSGDATFLVNAFGLRPDLDCHELAHTFLVDFLPIVARPDEAGLAYEEHWLLAEDGIHPLRVWLLPSTLDRGLVILSEGAGGSIPCYLFHAQLLVNKGWSVVMYDYRGFGASGGGAGVENIIPDARIVFDWALEYTGSPRASLFGISLGSIPSVALARERPEQVNCLVLDSPVALGATIEHFGRILGPAAQAVVDLLPPDLISEEVITQVRTPTLIFLDEADQLTVPSTVQLLYERAAGPKTLVRLPGLPHAWGAFWATSQYSYEIENALSRAWGQRRDFTAQYGVGETRPAVTVIR